MKIIDVAEHYAPEGGGVKTYIHNKMKAAEACGHEMIIIAPGNKDDIEYKYGSKIVWIKSPKLWVDKRYHVFANNRALYEILDQEDPDIVEGGSVWAGGRMVSRWPGRAKKVWIFHQDFVAAYGHTFLDRYLKRGHIDSLFKPFWSYLKGVSMGYDQTIVAGDWLAERLGQFNINKPISIPFGIDKSFFSSQHKSDAMRKRLLAMCGRSTDCPLMITVSRFHPEKRLRTLFESVRVMNEKRPVAHVVFGEGVLSKRDRAYATKTDGICLAGFTQNREELAQALASSDLLLHGSAAETFGLGVAEALCSGLPVVGPSTGGVSDLIAGRYGCPYEAGSVDDCVTAIEEVVSRSKAEWLPIINDRAKDIKTTNEHFDHLFTHYTEMISSH